MRRQLWALILALFAFASPAFAQGDYPAKPIRMLIPSGAGGGIDILARIFSQRLAEQMGKQIVVENQGGGGGTIAAAAVARAAPDGYTLIFQAVNAVVNAVVLTQLPYDPVKDFAPVTLVARFPLVLVVNPAIPAKDLRQFIDLLRKNPGKYNYGSAGHATGTHLAAEWFRTLARVDIVHVPYKGTGAVTPDLVSGRISMMINGLPAETPNIKSGKVRALAVTTTSRAETLPDVPAMAEVLAGYDIPFWTAIFAPAKTPPVIIERLADETRRAARSPQTIERLRELGAEGIGSTPAEFEAYWQQQLALYARIVKEANIKLNPN